MSALRVSAEAVLRAVRDAVIVSDGRGVILRANPACATLLGWPEEELAGQPISVLVPPNLRALHERGVRLAAETGALRYGGHVLELPALRRDGSTVPVELTLSAWDEPGGRLFVGVLRDIGERGRMRDALVEAKHAADRAVLARDELIAIVSHQLRAPLHALLGLTELLGLTRLDVSQRRDLDTLARSGELMLSVVDDALDLSSLEAGLLVLDTSEFDLRAVVDGTVELFGGQAATKELGLWCFVDRDVPATALGDARRLRQVLANLLDNAIRFTDVGEIVVRVRRARDELLISVADTGLGMTAEELDDAVGRRNLPRARGRHRRAGAKLGLAISARLVEAMGGALGATGEEGVGTAVEVRLPLRTPATERASAAPPVPRAIVGSVGRGAAERWLELLHTLGADARWTALGDEAGASASEASPSRAEGSPAPELGFVVGAPAARDAAALAAALRGRVGREDLPVVLVVGRDTTAGEALEARHRGCSLLEVPVSATRLRLELEALTARPPTGTAGGATRTPGLARPTRALARAGRPIEALLVEDEAVSQLVAARMLALLGCNVTVAGTGEAALREAARRTFDLVVLDCQLPGMDGLETARELRRRPARGERPAVVALTASAEPDLRLRCVEAGMDALLVKPVGLRELGAALERWSARGRRTSSAVGSGAHLVGPAHDGPSAELARVLGQTFEAEATGTLARLERALAGGDLDDLTRSAERLGAIARDLGALPLAERCSDLADGARRGDTSCLPALVVAVTTEVDAVRAALRVRRGAP